MVKTCRWEDCDKQVYAKGLCRNHHAKDWRGTLGRPKGPTICTFDGCERGVTTKALCQTHYAQQYRGKPLTPIAKKTYLHKDKKGRVCTACLTYKPWNEYYDKGQGKTSKCKRCMSDANNAINKRRRVQAA